MKYLLNMVFFFATGFIFSMDEDKNNKIRVFVEVGESTLLYLDKKKVDGLGNLGIKVPYNEPGFSLSQTPNGSVRRIWLSDEKPVNDENLCAAVRVLLQDVKELPLSCFVKTTEDNQQIFKEHEEVLCSMPMTHDGRSLTCEIYIEQEGLFFNRGVDNLKEHFRKSPNYFPDDQSQLINDNILAQWNGNIIHGPNGYFKDTKKPATSYFYYLKFPAIGLFMSYVLWIWWNKSN
jgi:hypothetical protein